MRKVIHIAWTITMQAVVIGTLIIGLSLLGGFVAYQIEDWKQSHSAHNTHKTK